MEQLSLTDPSVDWRALVERVVRDSVVVEIQQGETTIARISPVAGKVTFGSLNRALASVPPLSEEADSFADDLNTIRHSVPAEPSPWD